jgi:hypothetical protein
MGVFFAIRKMKKRKSHLYKKVTRLGGLFVRPFPGKRRLSSSTALLEDRMKKGGLAVPLNCED